MNNYFKILLAASLLLFPCLTWAQDKEKDAEKEDVRLPLPEAPILEKTADNQQWKIKLKGLAPGAEAPTTSEPQGSEVVERIYKKLDTVKYLEKKWSDGKKTGSWIFKPYQLQEANYSPGLIEVLDQGGGAEGDFSDSDFPDLGWINETNYITTDKIGGKLCYLFKRPNTDSSVLKYMGREFAESVAKDVKVSEDKVWVSVETRLPVQLETNGKIFEYSFSAFSGDIPEPPAKVLELKAAIGLK